MIISGYIEGSNSPVTEEILEFFLVGCVRSFMRFKVVLKATEEVVLLAL